MQAAKPPTRLNEPRAWNESSSPRPRIETPGVAQDADRFLDFSFESDLRAAASAPRPLACRAWSCSAPASRIRDHEVPPCDRHKYQAEQDAHELEESDGGGPALEQLDETESRAPLDDRAAVSVVSCAVFAQSMPAVFTNSTSYAFMLVC